MLRSAVAASLPSLIGDRSRIDSGTVMSAPPWHSGCRRRAARGVRAGSRRRGRRCGTAPARCSSGTTSSTMTGRSVAFTAGRSRTAVEAQPLPAQRAAPPVRRACRRKPGVGTGVDCRRERDEDVGVDLEIGATGLRDLAEDRPHRVVVLRGDEDQIDAARGEFVDRELVCQGGDDGLALWWPRGDRRPLDGEVLSGEVDVVQLVAVDVSAGRDVADHRVVLPAVPQPPDHLDGVAGLVEQVRPGDVSPTEQLRPRVGSC